LTVDSRLKGSRIALHVRASLFGMSDESDSTYPFNRR
jgi:hypothetical protein